MGGDGFLERDQQHCVVTPTITSILPRARPHTHQPHSLHRGPVYLGNVQKHTDAAGRIACWIVGGLRL